MAQTLLDIFLLSLRQTARPRRLMVILLIAAVPVALSAIARLNPPGGSPDQFRDTVLMGPLVLAAVMPIVTLVFCTATFGQEMEDRTLSFLLLKPIPRWAVVLPKLAASMLTSAAVVLASGGLTVVIAPGGEAITVGAVLLGLLAGIAAYSAIFVWAGLITSHALAIGLVYVFVWEASLTSFLQGVRYLSVRQYTLGTIHAVDDAQFTGRSDLLGPEVAVTAAVIVFLAFTVLSVRRLQTMDVP
ncbi:MAG: ABC transporter permease [Chloroflexota bacterium]